MAYDRNSLNILVPRVGTGDGGANAGESSALWVYRSDDPPATVIAGTYLADALDLGMKVGDLCLIADNGATGTIHIVTVVAATGATLI